MKPVDVSTVIDIARPGDEVAAYISDPDNAPSWYANIERVAWQTGKPLATGTRLDFVGRFWVGLSPTLRGNRLRSGRADGHGDG
jgi:hypothetical protein